MSTSKPHQARRWVSDTRADSHLRWLRSAYALALNTERPPSDSLIVRRALARLAEHMNDLLLAGRDAGFQGPHPQDAAAETKLLEEYAAITSAPPPSGVVDTDGRFLLFQEAIAQSVQRRHTLDLSIPTAEDDTRPTVDAT